MKRDNMGMTQLKHFFQALDIHGITEQAIKYLIPMTLMRSKMYKIFKKPQLPFNTCKKQFLMIAKFAVACCVSLPAVAESIRLEKTEQAASLHQAGVDMVVYYIDMKEYFDVVATFNDGTKPYLPAQLRMSMNEGDGVTFTVPGRPDVAFLFARSGNVIEVHHRNTEQPAVVASH
ncbi:MAG: hypothetical protein AB8B62_19820 [Roseobacter sp.]